MSPSLLPLLFYPPTTPMPLLYQLQSSLLGLWIATTHIHLPMSSHMDRLQCWTRSSKSKGSYAAAVTEFPWVPSVLPFFSLPPPCSQRLIHRTVFQSPCCLQSLQNMLVVNVSYSTSTKPWSIAASRYLPCLAPHLSLFPFIYPLSA